MPLKLPINININALLHRRAVESERIEYKEGWNPEVILHTLCAFANDFHNLGGGYVVIGVTEKNGQPQLPPVGLMPSQIDAIQKELLNLGHSAIAPHFHPLTAIYEIEGKTILVLWAPGGETRPYKAKTSLSGKKNDWAYYLRKQSSTVKATGENERELMSLAAPRKKLFPRTWGCCFSMNIQKRFSRPLKSTWCIFLMGQVVTVSRKKSFAVHWGELHAMQ